MRILVVEDASELLELVAIVLRSEGYRVLTAANGVDGLRLARSERPDLIIADVEMPLMDGFELLRHVRGDPHLAQRPVLAFTACAMRGDRERILRAGFTGYISKPVRPRELIEQINAWRCTRQAFSAAVATS